MVAVRSACYGLGQAWLLLVESVPGHQSCRWHVRAGAAGLGSGPELGRPTAGAGHALPQPSFALVRPSEFMGKALASLPRRDTWPRSWSGPAGLAQLFKPSGPRRSRP